MPEKSIREMSWLERQHYSLGAKTFRMAIMGSIILGLVSLLIGLGLYTYSLASRYVSTAFNLSKNVADISAKIVDATAISNSTMDIYRSLSDEDRQKEDTEEYYSRFAAVAEGSDYQQLMEILTDFYETGDVFDVYYAMYDKDRCRLVYITDPDMEEGDLNNIGQTDPVQQAEVDKFLNWNGEGMLYHIEKSEKYGWLCTSGVPVRDERGEISGFFLADITLDNVIRGANLFFLQFAVAMFLVVNIVGILMARRMRKKIAEPINKIAEASSQYILDKKKGISETDHFSKLEIRTGDEVENLALMLKDMEIELSEYEKTLTAVTEEKERINTELSLATKIQADMLPNIYPAFPERSEFDVYAIMHPAKEVGGDFYDFFLIDENRLGIVMADVSGKGVPAALFMMASKILLQNHAMMGKSPKEVLQDVNNQICANNREEMFVTVWFGILDLETGVMTSANAGHEYPAVKHKDGKFELFKDKHGFVIGGMSGLKYSEYTIQLEPGSKLFVYTDGVAEATNSESELFGTDRMIEALNSVEADSPVAIVDGVFASIGNFVKEAPQFDDITMLCLVYNGKGNEMKKQLKEMTVEATVDNIPAVTAFVDEELEKLDCPIKAQTQIDIAIDELFGNIAHYAYDPETGPATVRVEVEQDPLSVLITFIDHGKQYDPLAKPDPDVTLSAEERQIGGLGIFLVKKTMDDVVYEYTNGQNILKIKKRI